MNLMGVQVYAGIELSPEQIGKLYADNVLEQKLAEAMGWKLLAIPNKGVWWVDHNSVLQVPTDDWYPRRKIEQAIIVAERVMKSHWTLCHYWPHGYSATVDNYEVDGDTAAGVLCRATAKALKLEVAA